MERILSDTVAPESERFYCETCSKEHRDGDKVEVIRTPSMIGVKCMAHAVWANRKAIAELMGTLKR